MYFSWFMLFLLLSVAALIGYALSNFFKNKTDKDWKAKCLEAEKKYSEVHNENKKDKKKITNLTRQGETWKNKFEESEAKYIPITKKLETEKVELQESLDTKTTEFNKLQVTFKQIENKNERMSIELQKLKEKYATDLSDSKGWKNIRDRLNRQLDETKAKLEKSEKDKAKLNLKLEAQNKEVLEARKISSQFRVLKATNSKLNKDLAYWEKKHYDTHHELASSLTKIEELKEANKEVDLLHKGALIKEQNLLEKIQEFKTKFVNVNNKYHELINK